MRIPSKITYFAILFVFYVAFCSVVFDRYAYFLPRYRSFCIKLAHASCFVRVFRYIGFVLRFDANPKLFILISYAHLLSNSLFVSGLRVFLYLLSAIIRFDFSAPTKSRITIFTQSK